MLWDATSANRANRKAEIRAERARAPQAPRLSDREVEVLQLVADGLSNQEVGAQLGLSPLTVKSHLARIGVKLGTGDRTRMVVLTMRSGVVR